MAVLALLPGLSQAQGLGDALALSKSALNLQLRHYMGDMVIIAERVERWEDLDFIGEIDDMRRELHAEVAEPADAHHADPMRRVGMLVEGRPDRRPATEERAGRLPLRHRRC